MRYDYRLCEARNARFLKIDKRLLIDEGDLLAYLDSIAGDPESMKRTSLVSLENLNG